MSKTVTLADAEQQLTAATAAVDQIKARLVDEGPGSVTAEELGAAVLTVEHARLTVEHAGQQAQAQAEAERLDHLQLLKAQILDQAGDVDTALAAMTAIEDAAAVLIGACAGRQKLIAQATAALRNAGVPEGSQTATEHAGLGWTNAGMARGDAVHVDGRSIAALNAGVLIAAALTRGARQVQRHVRYLTPAVDVPGSEQALVQDPESWLRAKY
ncbi:hypothetical protein [Streptomyces phaeochromogenes]|uniref:hypothetical protein n=1 Tax=Streptomyces phaeochromogenes TaxID=1923 RepID=UPI0006E1F3E3|nr:hypothetical protein [Streptomyces phaeochromogenes]